VWLDWACSSWGRVGGGHELNIEVSGGYDVVLKYEHIPACSHNTSGLYYLSVFQPMCCFSSSTCFLQCQFKASYSGQR
jgi:hypothetical protein